MCVAKFSRKIYTYRLACELAFTTHPHTHTQFIFGMVLILCVFRI